MASTCYSLLRVPAVRVTKLDACGNVVEGPSSVATNGVITIEQTVEQEDRQDYFALNADGEACVRDTAPPILKWINVTITFCKVDPELFNIMTAEPLVLNDAVAPAAVGFRTREGSVANANFAFESWQRVGGDSACDNGEVNYGYFLLPWVKEATVGDLTQENGLANFTVTGRTSYGSPWGLGPYSIRKIESGVGVGNPAPLLTAIVAGDHRHMQLTTLAPPTPTCGATTVEGELTVADAGAGLDANLTLPEGLTLPAVVDWGDGDTETVPAGTVSPVVHTYDAAGPYTVTITSSAVSGPVWTGDVTIAA